MKKLLFLFVIFILFVGCTSSSQRELYKTTDYFVNSLSTEYESYGLMGQKYSKTTEDGTYTVFPIGRLINVKIEKYVEDDKYEHLKKDLLQHYKNDTRVHDVYICQGGTIMIDCRN
jgi:hypothetical protein